MSLVSLSLSVFGVSLSPMPLGMCVASLTWCVYGISRSVCLWCLSLGVCRVVSLSWCSACMVSLVCLTLVSLVCLPVVSLVCLSPQGLVEALSLVARDLQRETDLRQGRHTRDTGETSVSCHDVLVSFCVPS